MRLMDDFLPEGRVAKTSILTGNMSGSHLYSSVIGLLSNMFQACLILSASSGSIHTGFLHADASERSQANFCPRETWTTQ